MIVVNMLLHVFNLSMREFILKRCITLKGFTLFDTITKDILVFRLSPKNFLKTLLYATLYSLFIYYTYRGNVLMI